MARYNAAQGLGGAASGALAGAAAGSAIPGIGTLFGGIGGGIAGLFGGFGGNKKRKPKKYSTLDPTQEAIYGNYAESLNGTGPYADLYNFDEGQANNVFDQTVGRYANRDFNEKIIPSITGQFRGNNLQNSSYAGQALANAGRDVQEGLNAQRASMNYQGQQNAQGYKRDAITDILNRQTFAYDQPEAQQPGFMDQILGSVAQNAGGYLRDYIGRNRPGQGQMQSLGALNPAAYAGRVG